MCVSRAASVLVLILAASLEAGGDAIVRIGLHSTSTWHRAALFTVGAVVLFAYGWTVNAPPWDFGRLLGLYVVFFFVIAQLISWMVFKQRPSLAVLAGGCLIVAGGVVISLSKM
jgi:drug/metabolite transporter superfamily protein YnfA